MLIDHYDFVVFFFFNVTATTEIYTLPLHDALRSAGHCHDCLSPHVRGWWWRTEPVSESLLRRRSCRSAVRSKEGARTGSCSDEHVSGCLRSWGMPEGGDSAGKTDPVR